MRKRVMSRKQMDKYQEVRMDEDNNNSGGMKITGNTTKQQPCVCNRPMAHIVCRKCGTEFDGRVFTHCVAHPNKIPLMDHQECVNRTCRSQMLSEISTQRK